MGPIGNQNATVPQKRNICIAIGDVLSSAGTLQLNNRRLIGCLISFTRSAGFNRSQYNGSAGKAQI